MGIINNQRTRQMGGKQNRIKVRVKPGRGFAPEFVLKEFRENFAKWEESWKTADEEDKKVMRELFNKIKEPDEDADEPGLGDLMLGPADEFNVGVGEMQGEDIKRFTDTL